MNPTSLKASDPAFASLYPYSEKCAPGMSMLAFTATAALQGMLANPDFEPLRQDGEASPEAYARRACDYAEALLAEAARRNGKDTHHE